MKEIVKLKDVWKIYKLGESLVYALRNVNFSIKEKDFIAIMGPSGSGKSTFLHLIGLLDRPTKGFIYFNGRKVSHLSRDQLANIRSKTIGFIFQQFNLVPYLTAIENVYLPQIFAEEKMEKDKAIEKAKELLHAVGLKGKEKHRPTELSGGEQQRVAIARALMNDPSIILADEPTGNLDSKTGKQIMELLVKLNEEDKKTIVVVTHDPSIAEFAKKHVRIKDGILEHDRIKGEEYLWRKNEKNTSI